MKRALIGFAGFGGPDIALREAGFQTVGANRRPVRAGLPQGRVVSMTPRALARFQQFPDDFVLPGDGEPELDENIALSSDPRSLRELACRGIGNALPPGLYRAVLKSLNIT